MNTSHWICHNCVDGDQDAYFAQDITTMRTLIPTKEAIERGEHPTHIRTCIDCNHVYIFIFSLERTEVFEQEKNK